MTFENKVEKPHADTLMCSKPRCKCVASDLELVEDRILQSLKIIKEEYQFYIDNYEDEVKKEILNNHDMIDAINHEIDKVKSQIEKACELVETGAYTQDLFIKRSNSLNEKMNDLITQKNELSKMKDSTLDLFSKKKAVPILEDILTKYSKDMTPSEKNKLLSSIIKQVIYTKEKGGRYLKDNFSIKIVLL